MPSKSSILFVWDATSPDTFAPTYSALASTKAHMVAAQAEERKPTKYCCLATNHRFTHVVIETSDVSDPKSSKFIHELGHSLERVTRDANSLNCLLQ